MSAPLPRVLCVDDEPRMLSALQRSLFEHYEVEVAEGGEAALALLASRPAFDVIISDQRMPGLQGSDLLERVRLGWPATERILLTGQADLDAATAAVNRGGVFRFLLKPCPHDVLMEALAAACERVRLRRERRELLEGTLTGVAGTLADILAMVAPEAFQRTTLLRRCAAHAAPRLGLGERAWMLEVAARLAEIGAVGGMPDNTPHSQVAESGARLLEKIPLLDGVARIVEWQDRAPPASLDPAEAACAQVLRAAHALEFGASRPEAGVAQLLGELRPALPEAVIEALRDFPLRQHLESQEVAVLALRAGDVLTAPLYTRTGTLLLGAGMTLSEASLEKLYRYAKSVGLREPISVTRAQAD